MKKLVTLALCLLMLLSLLSVCQAEAAGNPWVGLWRNAYISGTSLYSLNADGTFHFRVFPATGQNQVVTGKYKVSSDQITMSDRVYNGEKIGETTIPFGMIDGNTVVINGERCRRVPEKDASAVLANPTAPYNPGGIDAAAEYYTLGKDRIPSVLKVVGNRNIVNFDTEIANGTMVMVIVYWTDWADPTQAANDMAKYFQYLLALDDFIPLKSFDGLPYEGGVEMSFAKDSADEGNIVILDIDYNSKGYSLMFRKGEGKLTRN